MFETNPSKKPFSKRWKNLPTWWNRQRKPAQLYSLLHRCTMSNAIQRTSSMLVRSSHMTYRPRFIWNRCRIERGSDSSTGWLKWALIWPTQKWLSSSVLWWRCRRVWTWVALRHRMDKRKLQVWRSTTTWRCSLASNKAFCLKAVRSGL